MILKHSPIGAEGGHTAGRNLLKAMYEAQYGKTMPPILTTPLGKPYFEGERVYFSISHTPSHVFCALSDRPVGIDAEETDRDIRLALADKILSPSELSRYAREENKREALLRLWVLKEANAKCLGTGLQGYPNHTDFSPDDPRITMINGCFVAVIEKE